MNPTASGIESALHCPESVFLPQSRSTSDDAEDGHDVHAFAHDLIENVNVTEALAKRPSRLHKRLGNIRRHDLVGDLSDQVRSEVAYALNVVTDEVRELGVGIDREYPEDFGDEWIFGTVDIEGYRLDGVWACKDLKSGMLEVTPAAANLQLLFFGRVLWLLHGKEVVGEIVRVRPDGSTFTESGARYRAFDLDSFGDKLLEIREAILALEKKTREVATNEGSWCRYCAAFASCPAKQQLVRNLIPELEGIRDRVHTLSLEDAGKAWVKLKRIGQLYDVVEAALKERAAQRFLPTRPGYHVKPIRIERENFDQAAALALLRELGATPEQLKTLHVKKSHDQFREVKVR